MITLAKPPAGASPEDAIMLQRLFLAAWLVPALAMIYIGSAYQAPFAYEPVGPRAFPLLMLGLLATGLVYLLIHPTPLADDPDELPPGVEGYRKVGLGIALLLGFALAFEPLGFIPASTLAGLCFARLYGGRWLPSLGLAVVMALGLYLLFDRLLDVPLPLGLLAGLEI